MQPDQPGLQRRLGVVAGISINIANVIGTGVFLKTRVMTCNVEDPWLVLAVWLGAGLLALLGALCYAEVAAMMPEAGGDYVFLRRAYGRPISFLYGWTTFAIAKSGSQAALAIAVAIFLNLASGGLLERWQLGGSVFGHGLRIGGISLVALAAIWTVALINCASVATGGRTASLLTMLKIAMLLGVGIAAFGFAQGDWAHLGQSGAGGACEDVAASARGGFAGIGAAMLGALWAYDGWNNIAPLCGEVRNPQRNLPRIFLGGILVVAVLYLLVNSAYFYVLTPQQIASVPAVSSLATEVMQVVLGPVAVTLVALALMVSAYGSLHASVLANSRVPYAMARDGLFFRAVDRVSPHTHVPVRAVMAQAAWASVLALSGTFDTLTDAVVFTAWLFYGLTGASLFVFRQRLPDAPRPYRAWGYPLLPAVFVLLSIALLATTFVATPKQALVGAGLMLAGLPFYLYWSRRLPGATTAAAG